MGSNGWPEGMPVAQVRVARPTDRLEEVVNFYHDIIGLPIIASFTGHAGYDGVMIGLPSREFHLEFTRHEHGSLGDAPSKDNLLVLYIPDHESIERLGTRLTENGHAPVASENPYWDERGAITVEDPDGWRLVLMPTDGI
jgi:catechol 2,3-dioxygenase-like lactoylglutathione lyase family enzyme